MPFCNGMQVRTPFYNGMKVRTPFCNGMQVRTPICSGLALMNPPAFNRQLYKKGEGIEEGSTNEVKNLA
jgi:hypothetical protein